MIRLFFVGDGRRDAVTVPTLVKKLLGREIAEESRPWARLHEAGKGYSRKLLYAIRRAKDGRNAGVVAVVDQDRELRGKRLEALKQARMADREKYGAFPVAVGEACPHGEAWLPDDAAAVRKALRLAPDVSVPSVAKTRSPKLELERLQANSPRAAENHLAVWADIADWIEPTRYAHPDKSGFTAFAQDVRNELSYIVES